MHYMFLLFQREIECPPVGHDQWAALRKAHFELVDEARARGILQSAERLLQTDTATTVRLSQGKMLILDGPCEDRKEQLAGYYVIDCQNLDEALCWASRILATGGNGCVEIRPIAPLRRKHMRKDR